MRSAVLVSAFWIAACGPAGFGGTDDQVESDTAAVEAPVPSPAEAFAADIKIIPGEELMSQVRAPEGITVELVGGDKLSVSPAAIEQETPRGMAILFGEDFENRVGGHLVKVRLLLQGEPGGRVRASYWTNELGNSGWKTFELDGGVAEQSFEYNVPVPVAGNGDVLQILPQGSPVTVLAIGIDLQDPS